MQDAIVAGLALEAALPRWLPRHIDVTCIDFFLSWAPHCPDPEQGYETGGL